MNFIIFKSDADNTRAYVIALLVLLLSGAGILVGIWLYQATPKNVNHINGYTPNSHIDTTSRDDSSESRPFYNGEILYPDYAHNDTLVVFNAKELNRIFDGVDVSLLPKTDADISGILYKYAIQLNTSFSSQYGLEIEDTKDAIYYYIWDRNRLVAKFPSTSDLFIDSILMVDNE